MKFTEKQKRILRLVAFAIVGAVSGIFIIWSTHKMIRIHVKSDCLIHR